MQDQKNSLLHDADRIPTNDFGGVRSDSSDEILAPPVVEAPLSARHRSGRGGALGPTGMMMPPMMAGGMGMGAGGGAHAASAATSMRVTSAGGVLPPGAGMTGGATASSVTAANAGVSSGGFGAGTGSFSASGMGGWSPSSAPLPASGPAVSAGTHAADGADAGSSTPATLPDAPKTPNDAPHAGQPDRPDGHFTYDPNSSRFRYETYPENRRHDPGDTTGPYDPYDSNDRYHIGQSGRNRYQGYPGSDDSNGYPEPSGGARRTGALQASGVDADGFGVHLAQLDEAAAKWHSLADRLTRVCQWLNAAIAQAGDFGLVIHPQPDYAQAHATAQAQAKGSAADFTDTSGRLIRTSGYYRETEAANTKASSRIGSRG